MTHSAEMRKKQQLSWEARANGEFPTTKHRVSDRVSEATDRRLAIEERRELKAAISEVWDD